MGDAEGCSRPVAVVSFFPKNLWICMGYLINALSMLSCFVPRHDMAYLLLLGYPQLTRARLCSLATVQTTLGTRAFLSPLVPVASKGHTLTPTPLPLTASTKQSNDAPAKTSHPSACRLHDLQLFHSPTPRVQSLRTCTEYIAA